MSVRLEPDLETTIIHLAPYKILIWLLVFLAEHAGLNLTWSQTLKQGFSHQGPYHTYLYFAHICSVVSLNQI